MGYQHYCFLSTSDQGLGLGFKRNEGSGLRLLSTTGRRTGLAAMQFDGAPMNWQDILTRETVEVPSHHLNRPLPNGVMSKGRLRLEVPGMHFYTRKSQTIRITASGTKNPKLLTRNPKPSRFSRLPQDQATSPRTRMPMSSRPGLITHCFRVSGGFGING